MKKLLTVLCAGALLLPSVLPAAAVDRSAPVRDSVAVEKINFQNPAFLRGMDVSSVISLEDAGVTFRDERGEEQDLFKILADNGVIKLKEGLGVKATVQDVTENSKKLQFKEIEAAQLPRSLDDVTIAVINTNFAMQASLNPTKDSLFIEDKTSPYSNIVAVREGDEKRPEIQSLMKALQSKEVKEFIEKKYGGAIVPAF